MKRKTLSLCWVLALTAIAVAGGTMAYFSDTDAALSVMTTGNVDIEQIEKQRNEDGTALVDFQDNKPLLPAVFYNENGNPIAPDKTVGTADVPTWGLIGFEDVNGDTDYSKNLLDKSLENEVDKIVNVKNIGTGSAYVRTIFLMEDKVIDATRNYKEGKYLSDYVVEMWTENGNKNSGYYNYLLDENGEPVLVNINGTTYSVTAYYYEQPLEAGKTTCASLKQIYLDPNTTNDFYANLGADGEYTILTLSQAVQSQGFNDDRVALETAFGKIDAANCAVWFENIQ